MPLFLVIAAALLGAGILFYSQTAAFTGDEGFHLLAAQLIDKGKRPYIDFAFPQTPLNAYFNALWLRLFGQTWRVPHAVSSVLVIGAALLAAQFVWRRFPALAEVARRRGAGDDDRHLDECDGGGIRPAGASLRHMSISYGGCVPVGGGCRRPRLSGGRFGVGLCAGAAAASSLLTATAAPVYLLWMLFYNRAGNRWIKAAAYCLGGAIPFAPAFWLWMQSPRPVMFNLFEYHLSFRTLYWPKTTQHDLEIMTSWIDSGQALLLLLLSLAGLLFVLFRSQWERSVRREFYLCAWLTLGMCVEIATAHPTFARYFLLMVPFVAILAAVGPLHGKRTPLPARGALCGPLAVRRCCSLWALGNRSMSVPATCAPGPFMNRWRRR